MSLTASVVLFLLGMAGPHGITPCRAPDEVRPPAVGERFPDLVFPTLDGERSALSAFRGTKVLLIQFASW